MTVPDEPDPLVTEVRRRGERHGRWLDVRYGSGLFWTAPLLMLGAALGCWSAWRWMQAS